MSKNNGHDKDSHQAADGPLQKIKEKELEFGGKYLEAKKQAERIIADARKNASDIKVNSKESSLKESEEYYKKKLESMNRSRDKSDNKDAIMKVKNIAEKNYNKAYDYLLKLVVPHV